MHKKEQNSALVCIDLINEMITKDGKLSGKGYLNFAEKNNSLQNIKSLQDKFRKKGLEVFHIKVSFSENYLEHPENSILFGKAKEFKALQADSWGTEFVNLIKPNINEKIIIKRRISAFFGTDLESTLRIRGVNTIYLSGVATDLAIESAAREAHDRDFNVIIVSDCCIAANNEDHNKSLNTLQKISTIKILNEIEL